MQLPEVDDDQFTEQEGINAVCDIVTASRSIWRPTPLRDVGIDGQIEYVNRHRQATGRIVLVQVKAGKSYFANATDSEVRFYPSDRHKNYWEQALLPVILVLHNNTDGETIWVDARQEIRANRGRPIRLSRAQVFSVEKFTAVMETLGPLPTEPQSPGVVLKQMVEARSASTEFPLCYLDLFVNGLTDICHSLYFGMDLATEVVEARLELSEGGRWWALREGEYEFLDGYVAFLVANHLVRWDYDWYRQMTTEMQMVATLLGPLTRTGRQLVSHIMMMDELMGETMDRPRGVHIVEERLVTLDFRYAILRARWIETFKRQLLTP